MSDLDSLAIEAAACRACELCNTRKNVVFGEGNQNATMMFVGEGPGRDEDLVGRPFVGRSGKLLEKLIEQETGWDRGEVYIANTVKCRPPNNRNPLPEEIASCEGFLRSQVAIVNPTVIVTLGAVASRALLGVNEGIGSLRTQVFDFHGCVLIPTYHPAAALRGGTGVLAAMRSDLAKARLLADE
ncbi:MAG: uracil-DNA glycosylase [Acidimicrobiaceae bacterium]|nr:uracil-DNA glycosylase [Acidimicrobiaceae bacterium]